MSSELLDHRGRPRVAVTGMGVKTPAGADLDTFWETITGMLSRRFRIAISRASSCCSSQALRSASLLASSGYSGSAWKRC